MIEHLKSEVIVFALVLTALGLLNGCLDTGVPHHPGLDGVAGDVSVADAGDLLSDDTDLTAEELPDVTVPDDGEVLQPDIPLDSEPADAEEDAGDTAIPSDADVDDGGCEADCEAPDAEVWEEYVCEGDCDGKGCGEDDGCGDACVVQDCAGEQEMCLEIEAEVGCVCVADCNCLDCGDDGCGGTCGECLEEQHECLEGVCVCEPDCDGKECGEDGCGTQCGDCLEQHECQEGACVCIPDCDGKECGGDGCGGNCGECLDAQHECQEGACVCVPECQDKECGEDGCDGSCGECTGPQAECSQGICTCIPDCVDKDCGTDGCGGDCGVCPGDQDICFGGGCICIPACDGKNCGDDGCGSLCAPGFCPGPQDACVSGVCTCLPECEGKECGADGCGGTCGACVDELSCTNSVCDQGLCQFPVQDFFCLVEGICVPSGTENPQNVCEKCQPAISKLAWSSLPDGLTCGADMACYQGSCCDFGANCEGKECGDDGCGGTCAECEGSQDICVDGLCECQPACDGIECGSDGCGSECGSCDGGKLCVDGACSCVPEFSDGCCGNNVCWFDSCGVQGGTVAECQHGCIDGECDNCTPDCNGKVCGADGCGGECGVCVGPQDLCVGGACICQPLCTDLVCGEDGCGGSCGDCVGPQELCVGGDCVCQPDCVGKQCGDDGCGGDCGICTGPLDLCVAGSCECQPACAGKACGPDGCGGVCGECDDLLACTDDSCVGGACASTILGLYCVLEGSCVPTGELNQTNLCEECAPGISQDAWTPLADGAGCGDGMACYQGACCNYAANCTGKDCGSDGCGGGCGSCTGPQDVCLSGLCTCIAECTGKECGADGCGDDCGVCPGPQDLCNESGLCECIPACEGKVCGADGCGGSCGECACGEECSTGACVFTACDGLNCGTDGCGGSCGTCTGPQDICIDGLCTCAPFCTGKECGPDGCGEECGTCDPGQVCINGLCPPPGDECYDDNNDNWDGCTDGGLTEFGTSLETTGDQFYPAAGVFEDGGYVIAWQSKDQDGDDFGVFVRAFDAAGGTTGPEVQVNQVATDIQQNPDLAVLADGGFVVTWESKNQDGDGFGIFARLFQGDGDPSGNEFGVNSYTEGDQFNPAAAALPGGHFLVVWDGEGDEDDKGVFCQRKTGSGAKQGLAKQVNTETDDTQAFPAVAALGGDDFVVVWQSKDQDGNANGIFGQRMMGNCAKAGSEFQVNTYYSGEQMSPAVTGLAGGDFVVMWHGKNDVDSMGIHGQAYQADGTLEGQQFMINATVAENQLYPCAAHTGGGAFVSGWESNKQDGNAHGVVGRRFLGDLTPAGAEFVANVYFDSEQRAVDCAAFDDGSYIFAWHGKDQDGDGYGVFAQRYGADGAKIYH